MKRKTIRELAEHIKGKIIGDSELEIASAATLSQAGPGDISFFSNPKYEKELRTTKAAAIIVAPDAPISNMKDKTFILAQDPYYAFMQIIVLLYGYRQHPDTGLSPRASIADSAKIGKNVNINDFVWIGENVQIGDNTRIYPNCSIGPGTKIGNDCIIYANVTIYDNCVLGDRVTLHSGTVIGQDGFGYATHDGIHHKIPQIGRVIIEDDVEMGANCAIDRATMGDTIIGKGTKMSDLIAIGHGTHIGPNCLLVAQTGIAGSVEVGKYCVFAGQVGVVGHIKIGDGVRIGAQAGVINDVPAGQTIVGSPAQPITQAKRSLLLLKDLPEFRKKLKKMEKTVQNLQDSGQKDH